MEQSIGTGMMRNRKENWYSLTQPVIQWTMPSDTTAHGISSLFCQFESTSDQQWPGIAAALISVRTSLSTQHQNTDPAEHH